MTQIVWGAPGDKEIQTGLDHGVLYPGSGEGVPWVGLVGLTENVSGGEQESFYYDGVKYLDVISYEDYQATLEAFAAPEEFGVCDGTRQIALGLFATQQPRVPFSFSYRTLVGNDLDESAGYKIHLVYNCMAAPAERTWTTKSNETQAPTMTWTLYSKPPKAALYAGLTYKPTAHLILDSRSFGTDPTGRFEVLRNVLYGMPVGATPVAPFPDGLPHLPTQQQIVQYINTGFWS
jgi:hypothetical protein